MVEKELKLKDITQGMYRCSSEINDDIAIEIDEDNLLIQIDKIYLIANSDFVNDLDLITADDRSFATMLIERSIEHNDVAVYNKNDIIYVKNLKKLINEKKVYDINTLLPLTLETLNKFKPLYAIDEIIYHIIEKIELNSYNYIRGDEAYFVRDQDTGKVIVSPDCDWGVGEWENNATQSLNFDKI